MTSLSARTVLTVGILTALATGCGNAAGDGDAEGGGGAAEGGAAEGGAAEGGAAEGGAGGGGAGSCVDPGAVLAWSLTLPSGETYFHDVEPATQELLPFQISGAVTLDGDAIVIGAEPDALRLELGDGSAPLPTGLVDGAAVVAQGEVNSITYPGSPASWRLDLRIDNDDVGAGVEAGDRLWLLVSSRGLEDTTPFVFDFEDSCQLPMFSYQSRWLVGVASEGPLQPLAEGDSLDLDVQGGPHAGAYEVLAFNATFPLEGSSRNEIVVRRADGDPL